MQKISQLIAGVLFSFTVFSQPGADTLRISVPDAEKIFLQKNLSLLAARYNIDINKALVRQAKLWDNPVLATDQNIYDGRFFRHDASYGQIYLQVQQLIVTAGKRSKLVQMAQDNVYLSQEQFDDVMRSLLFTLRNDLLQTALLVRTSDEYSNEIEQVTKLVRGMDEVYRAGNISLKDNLRLKASLFELQNEQGQVQEQLIPLQSEIKLLLQSTNGSFVVPQYDLQINNILQLNIPAADSLILLAMNNRPDKKIEEMNLSLRQHNLAYQKALAKPDITIGTEYDRLNSYQPNYFGLSLSLPLNILNKNQGNIKAAGLAIQQQQTQSEQTKNSISNEVMAAVAKIAHLLKINSSDRTGFTVQYDKLYANMLMSYQQRQISLLDFTDFLDSYKNTRLRVLQQQFSLLQAIAELNYVTNSNIITIQ